MSASSESVRKRNHEELEGQDGVSIIGTYGHLQRLPGFASSSSGSSSESSDFSALSSVTLQDSRLAHKSFIPPRRMGFKLPRKAHPVAQQLTLVQQVIVAISAQNGDIISNQGKVSKENLVPRTIAAYIAPCWVAGEIQITSLKYVAGSTRPDLSTHEKIPGKSEKRIIANYLLQSDTNPTTLLNRLIDLAKQQNGYKKNICLILVGRDASVVEQIKSRLKTAKYLDHLRLMSRVYDIDNNKLKPIQIEHTPLTQTKIPQFSI